MTTEYRNPLPILTEFCGVKISDIRAVVSGFDMSLSSAHELCKRKVISKKLHSNFRKLTLYHWGTATNPDIRQLLWDCYFEGHKPHIYHLLGFVFCIPDEQLCQEAHISPATLRRIYSRPKLLKRQLQAIAPFALKYRDALMSPKQKLGPDRRHVLIHMALRDRKRLYDKGEIVAD